jgi:cyclohexanecarboxylate-CoA ligase
MARRITDCVATAARRQPNDLAVVDVRESTTCIWSWAKLWHESEKVAGLLLRLGVGSAETVAYLLPNCAESVAITLGVLRVGGVCCPLWANANEQALQMALLRSRARVLFVADAWAGRCYVEEVAALAAHCPCLEHIIVVRTGTAKLGLPTNTRLSWERFHRATAVAPPSSEILDRRRPAADSVAQLLFASSDSGLVGILHRHESLMGAVGVHAERLGLEGADRIVVASSVAEQAGFLYGMWLALALGLPQIVLGSWNPTRALRAIRDWRATFVQAPSDMLNELLQAAKTSLDIQLPLRLMVPASASLPPELIVRAHELHIRLCAAFGTPESCLATLVSPTDVSEKTSGHGRALPGVRLRICDEDNRELPAGLQGQLQIRSETLFAGYLGDDVRTADAYTPDGWYRADTQALIDNEGRLHLSAQRIETKAIGACALIRTPRGSSWEITT